MNLNSLIFLKDCCQFLPSIAANSVDLIATDPPYAINYAEWDKELDWEFLANQFNRVLKPKGSLVLFQGWSHVAETKSVLERHMELKNWIVWDRIKGRGAKTNFVSTREDILWFIKDSKSFTFNKVPSNTPKKTGGMGKKNGQLNRALTNVWYDISPIVPWSKEKVQHPTQKPVQIMERIVKIWSNPGDVVLDPFMGSGTTGIAALNLDRKFLGVESNSDYYKIANKRLLDILNKS